MRKLINFMRRFIDKYDEKHGLRKWTPITCTSERRNERRRERFRIEKEKPQCPVYSDNRCCGGCNLLATCNYATRCDCWGFYAGALGYERYYMLEDDYEKYGRFVNGAFDWDFYKFNRYKIEMKIGKYAYVSKIADLGVTKEQEQLISDKELRFGRILTLVDDDGFLDVELVPLDKTLENERYTMKVNMKGLGQNTCDNKNEVMRWI